MKRMIKYVVFKLSVLRKGGNYEAEINKTGKSLDYV